MILVDASVWVDHLRAADAGLIHLLGTYSVLSHPFVIGELALGNLRQRETVLGAITNLPHACVATGAEVMHLIDRHDLGAVASAMSMPTFSRQRS